MRRWTTFGILIVVAATLVLIFVRRDTGVTAAEPGAEISIGELLAASADEDFAGVRYPHTFEFPLDHGPHNAFRTEWWSITGVLQDDAGEALGLQMLLTRIGLRTGENLRQSRWAANDIYAGLASVSQPGGGPPASAQRLSRGALGLAGAALDPVRFWVEDWRFEAPAGTERAIALHGRFAVGELAVELRLENNAAPLTDTNALPGPAGGQRVPFQFYLQPRMQVTGTLRSDQGVAHVTGAATFEHAWGELPLPGGPVARDRMTLYLADQRVIMAVVTHRADGSGAPEAAGVLIAADGQPDVLSPDELRLEPVRTWTSPRSGGSYPVEWQLRIPGYGLDVRLHAVADDQEAREWTAFWAGPIVVRDTEDDAIGQGFAQLYGYAAH